MDMYAAVQTSGFLMLETCPWGVLEELWRSVRETDYPGMKIVSVCPIGLPKEFPLRELERTGQLVGSKVPLNVHIPVTELEEPMIQNVLRKAKRVQEDTNEQERIFRESMNQLKR